MSEPIRFGTAVAGGIFTYEERGKEPSVITITVTGRGSDGQIHEWCAIEAVVDPQCKMEMAIAMDKSEDPDTAGDDAMVESETHG